jgi:hypothetical protein
MVHFPVAFWTVAAGAIILRSLSDRPLARAFDRVLVACLVIGETAGLLAYVLGQLVWPPDTLQATPLGRNHMMAATWSLFFFGSVLVLRWRAGEQVWQGPVNRMVMLLLGSLGALLLAITGTLGGHLHGAPARLSDLLKMVGFNVYETFYLPSWMLGVVAVVIVALLALGVVGARTPAGSAPRQEDPT